MLSKTGGELMLVAHMPGEKSIALTMTKRVDVEIFVSLVFGALQKTQGIMQSRFVESWITVQRTTAQKILAKRRNEQ
jgi:hypothetical protein